MFGLRRHVREDPVRAVQDALSATVTMSLSSMTAALDTIVDGHLWQQGRPFESFGDFAVALPPVGLGVRSLEPLRLLRHALLDGGHFAQWTEILERTVRPRGRPRKKLVNDEDFEPFYTMPTAATSRDRILLNLKRNYPDQFAAVCERKLSPREAAIQAGLIAAGSCSIWRSLQPCCGRRSERASTGQTSVRSVQRDERQCSMRSHLSRARATFGIWSRRAVAG